MRVALITTTINTPTVLELYRQHGPDVAMFVAGDLKEAAGVAEFCESIRATFLSAPSQAALGYRCSDLLGWNTLARRNIALLEAVKWGADIIVTIDDDNIPFDYEPIEYVPTYFKQFERTLTNTHQGFKVSSPTGWFDVGTLLEPRAPHRGFPHDIQSQMVVSHVVGARVGVAAGICLGDPDIDSVTRMVLHPEVHRVSELLNSGLVVDPATRTVFNSQNTAFIRELAPAMFMMPGVGRHDDIYASLITQRVMRERGLHIHFGKPYVWQQRNEHNLVTDLRKEIDGMEGVRRLAKCLDRIVLEAGASTVAHTAQCYHELQEEAAFLCPRQSTDAAFAFLEDIEALL